VDAQPALIDRLRDERSAVRSVARRALARIAARERDDEKATIETLQALPERVQDPAEARDIRDTPDWLSKE